jgi:hypothetical protein
MERQQMGKGKGGYKGANGATSCNVGYELEHGRAPPQTAARRKKVDVAPWAMQVWPCQLRTK